MEKLTKEISSSGVGRINSLFKSWGLEILGLRIHLAKQILLHVVLLVITLQYTHAQTLVAASASGSGSTNGGSFATVTGVSVTVNVTGVEAVLVVSSFEIEMASPGADTRESRFRLADIDDPDNINSGNLRRSLHNPNSTDFGIGSVVYIFDVSACSGNKTYALQHSFSTAARTLTTTGTVIAVALTADGEHLKNDMIRVSSPILMSDSWDAVTGGVTKKITTTVSGGFYISTSIESKSQNFDSESVAEWKLQYKKGDEGVWTNLGNSVERSMDGVFGRGIVSLTGILPDETPPGDYYFRLAHRRVSATSTINTEAVNLVVVSLGVEAGVFPVFKSESSEVITSSTTLSAATTSVITPTLDMDLFLHAQYTISADDETNSAVYDLFVDNDILNGENQRRYLKDAVSIGSGVSIGLARNLMASTAYNVSLRHASASGNILTSNDISLNGFSLVVNSGPLPVRMMFVNAKCRDGLGATISWATAVELNNDYFTIYRSNDNINWKTIGKVKGAGNSNGINYYEYTDETRAVNDTWYRLIQTDIDGQSEVLMASTFVSCKDYGGDFKVFPNPAPGYFICEFKNRSQIEKPATLCLYNSTGKLCFSYTFRCGSSKNVIQIVVPKSVDPGLYFIHVKSHDEYIHAGVIKITG